MGGVMRIDDLPVLQKPVIGSIPVVERVEIYLCDGRYLLRYVAGRMKKDLVCASMVVESSGVKYVEDYNREYISISDIQRYIPLRPMIERIK